MKKMLIALAVAVSLIFAPIAMAKPSLSNGVGIKASHKSLELQEACDREGNNCISWLMIEDRVRLKERINNGLDFEPAQVLGFRTPSGNYFVIITVGWFRLPLGEIPTAWLMEKFPGTKGILDNIKPAKFMTFTGFEDIFWYFDVSGEGQEEKALKLIRERNMNDLNKYDTHGYMR
jgi:hypothetical protein